MKRIDCLRFLASLVSDEPVVTTITGADGEWRAVSGYEGTMRVGQMGLATSIGAGLAMACPDRRVIVLDGDGSALLDLAALAALGTYQPRNLAVFVFDNESYAGAAIFYPTATATGTDLAAMARGAGIASAITVSDLPAFESAARPAFEGDGLVYVVAKVEQDSTWRELSAVQRREPNRPDTLESKYRFVRWLEKTSAGKAPQEGFEPPT